MYTAICFLSFTFNKWPILFSVSSCWESDKYNMYFYLYRMAYPYAALLTNTLRRHDLLYTDRVNLKKNLHGTENKKKNLQIE